MIVRCAHLEALKVICHLCAHCDKESRSSWGIPCTPIYVVILLYKIQGIKSHEMNNPLNDEDLQIPKDMHDCKIFAPPYS